MGVEKYNKLLNIKTWYIDFLKLYIIFLFSQFVRILKLTRVVKTNILQKNSLLKTLTTSYRYTIILFIYIYRSIDIGL